jgi:hypothetical protein
MPGNVRTGAHGGAPPTAPLLALQKGERVGRFWLLQFTVVGLKIKCPCKAVPGYALADSTGSAARQRGPGCRLWRRDEGAGREVLVPPGQVATRRRPTVDQEFPHPALNHLAHACGFLWHSKAVELVRVWRFIPDGWYTSSTAWRSIFGHSNV